MAQEDFKTNQIEVTGMVLKQQPMGENDKRVVILTRERGKISGFAHGARRPNSPLLASTDTFCYGTFRLIEGKNSFSILEASIDNYFSFFRTHVNEAMLGQYFCEICDYAAQENNDESQLLLLLYQSLRALMIEDYPKKLVRTVFEIRSVVIEGEFRPVDSLKVRPSTKKAVDYIMTSDIAHLYSFAVDEPTLRELTDLARRRLSECFEHRFRSAEVLDVLGI